MKLEMKKLIILTVTTVLCGVLLVACGGNGDSATNDSDTTDTLVGLWEDEYNGTLILLNDDGSGELIERGRYIRNSDHFSLEWSINQDVLTIDLDNGTTDIFDYTFEGNHLTLSSDGFEENFNRLEMGSILGSWSDDRSYSYTFNADGTGSAIMIDQGEVTVEFEWISKDGILTLTVEDVSLEIDYTLFGHVIRMQAIGDNHTYVLERTE